MNFIASSFLGMVASFLVGGISGDDRGYSFCELVHLRTADHNGRNGHDDGPEKPSGLALRSWGGALGRTVREFKDDNLTDWAAALTYYSILSIFPALIAFVGIVGLVGKNPETTNAILNIIDDIGPASAVDTFDGPIQTVMTNKSDAGIALVVGLAVALWSA
jgi:membrane protein